MANNTTGASHPPSLALSRSPTNPAAYLPQTVGTGCPDNCISVSACSSSATQVFSEKTKPGKPGGCGPPPLQPCRPAAIELAPKREVGGPPVQLRPPFSPWHAREMQMTLTRAAACCNHREEPRHTRRAPLVTPPVFCIRFELLNGGKCLDIYSNGKVDGSPVDV